MSKNYIEEIANRLGVQFNEEFKVTSKNLIKVDNIYFFDERGLIDKHLNCCSLMIFLELLTGKREIVKLTNNFSVNDTIYYYSDEKWTIKQDKWKNFPSQIAMVKEGMIFKSKTDAFNSRPVLYKKYTGKDWKE